MTTTLTPVKGYTTQTQDRLDLVNGNKEIEEHLLRILDRMANDPDKFDQRWLAIARTDIEKGFMALNRSVFRPQRVSLSEE